MTGRNWLEKAGASPAKLALVGVLSLALVAVFRHNASSTAAAPPDKKARQATAPQNELVSQSRPVAVKMLQTQEPKKWPKIAFESIVAHDPFALPMWYLTAQADEAGTAGSLARTTQVLEELKKQKSKIVVITDEERVAMIGELNLRVGDTIEGFEVTEITTEGIVLTELRH